VSVVPFGVRGIDAGIARSGPTFPSMREADWTTLGCPSRVIFPVNSFDTFRTPHEDAEESRSPPEDLLSLWLALCLAQEVEQDMGRCEVLLGALS
jgi:hypothetical protein